MSRAAYLDCVGGIAGDMVLAALIDAGGDVEVVRDLPRRLGVAARIEVERVQRQGIGALHVQIEPLTDRPDARSWREIRGLLERADLEPPVLERALETFSRLADAEGRVHGVPADEVHFHELGSVDTLIDICGAAALFETLDIGHVSCSRLPMAGGTVAGAHGTLPLPAPATLELLRGVALVGVEGEAELVTPTGAALAATFATSFGVLPPLVLDRVGYGAGTIDLPDRPNILRILVGLPENQAVTGEVSLLETNLDDMPTELVPDAAARCLAVGAIDVWTVPAQMKKGRPGVVFSALARREHETAVATAILEETTALGVRVARLPRYELEREQRLVDLDGETVRVKVGILDGRIVNVAPEHDDCAALAARTGRSVKSVWAQALAAAQER
jgi:pyridinium-3,5-bisthiocarboxylic acid mononucleotide nickel chelatase